MDENNPLKTQSIQPEGPIEEPKVTEVPEEPVLESNTTETLEEPTLEQSATPISNPSIDSAPETASMETSNTTTAIEEPQTAPIENNIPSSEPVNFNTITPEEPTQPEPAMFVTPEKKPKSKSSNVLTLIAIFVALCGVAFGVYGMFLQEPKVITREIEVPAECEECEKCECDCEKNSDTKEDENNNESTTQTESESENETESNTEESIQTE